MLVVVGGERVVILPVRRRSTVQEVVEQLRPGRLVQRRGVGDDAVDVEQHGIVVARVDRDRQADVRAVALPASLFPNASGLDMTATLPHWSGLR